MTDEVKDLLCRVYTVLTEMDAEFDNGCMRPEQRTCGQCAFSKLAWDVFTLQNDVSRMLNADAEYRKSLFSPSTNGADVAEGGNDE